MYTKLISRFPILLALLWLPAVIYAQGPGSASFKAAEQMRKQKNCAGAIAKYDEAIKMEPSNYKYYYGKGKCLSKTDPNAAVAAFSEATKYKEDFSPAYASIAKIYVKKKEYDKAVQYFNLAFKYESDVNRKVIYKQTIVSILLKQERASEARTHVDQVKSLSPQDPRIPAMDGDVYGAQNQWAQAKDSYQRAVDLAKDLPPTTSAKYWYGLGLAYSKLGNTAEADKAWKNVPTNSPYYRKIKSDQSKSSHSYYYKLAVGYYKCGEDEEALSNLRKAVELTPTFSGGYKLMGIINYKKGRSQEAITNLTKAVDSEADANKKANLYNLMIKIQSGAGDYAGAIATANKILEKAPNTLGVVFQKGVAEYKIGQYNQAISSAERALTMAPADPNKKAQYYFLLGLAAKKAGDMEKAKKAFKDAMFGPYKAAANNELSKISTK